MTPADHAAIQARALAVEPPAAEVLQSDLRVVLRAYEELAIFVLIADGLDNPTSCKGAVGAIVHLLEQP